MTKQEIFYKLQKHSHRTAGWDSPLSRQSPALCVSADSRHQGGPRTMHSLEVASSLPQAISANHKRRVLVSPWKRCGVPLPLWPRLGPAGTYPATSAPLPWCEGATWSSDWTLAFFPWLCRHINLMYVEDKQAERERVGGPTYSQRAILFQLQNKK